MTTFAETTPAANDTGAKPPEPTPAPTPTPTGAQMPHAAHCTCYKCKPVLSSVPSASDPPAPKPKSTVIPEPDHPVPAEVDPLLATILSWPRRHKSLSEFAFCKFLREHIKALGVEPMLLAEGCVIATVKRPPKTVSKTVNGGSEVVTSEPSAPSTTLFSCHVDTVEHDNDGPQVTATPGEDSKVEVRKKLLNYDPNFGLIGLEKESIGGSLGADDGAGVWLMLKMIERKVPGTYLFHRGEEVGGIGSAAMRDKYPELLKAFECAVAFDRADTFEVIYMQGGQKCASLKFTEALCDRLNKQGMRYEPSTRGTFTDTKNYRKIIPECVNVAVGYECQHGRNETLNFAHLAALLEAVCNIDWDSLPIDRDPKEADYCSGNYSRSYGGGYYRDDDYDWPKKPHPANSTWPLSRTAGAGGKKKGKKKDPTTQQQQPALFQGGAPAMSIFDELSMCSLEDLEIWCSDHPGEAAKAMGQLLVELAQVRASNDMLMQLIGFKEEM